MNNGRSDFHIDSSNHGDPATQQQCHYQQERCQHPQLVFPE